MSAKNFSVALAMTFLLFMPTFVQAQTIPGTSVELSCEANDKLKRNLFYVDEDGKKKKVSKKAALKRLKHSQKLVRNIQKTTKKLQNAVKNVADDGKVSEHLSKKQIKHVKKHLTKLDKLLVPVPGGLGGPGAGPISEESMGALKELYDHLGETLPAMIEDSRQGIVKAKNCNGCEEESDSLEVRNSAFRRARSRKKRKCDCFTKTVPASFEFIARTNPESPSSCSAFILAHWSAEETKNATGVEVFWIQNSQGGLLKSKSGTPPYDDSYTFYGEDFSAPTGSHQLFLGADSKGSFNPDVTVECSDLSSDQRDLVIAPYYVEARICPAQ